MLIGRYFTFAIAVVLINIASFPDAARGNESGLFRPGFPPWPTPPKRPLVVPLRAAMRPPWLCVAVGLSTADFCQRVFMASSG